MQNKGKNVNLNSPNINLTQSGQSDPYSFILDLNYWTFPLIVLLGSEKMLSETFSLFLIIQPF